MIEAILLAILLAIIATNILLGPRGYRQLANADDAGRLRIYRRIPVAQLVLFALPAVVALLVLGRIDALGALPDELWPASSIARGGYPALRSDWFLIWLLTGVMMLAIVLGAALTLRRTRRGLGVPQSVAHIAALLPRNRAEVKCGIAISVAAGVSEELFFRLVLPMLLAAFVDPLAAVVLAALLFGLGHLYQGWKGVLITSVLGLVFTEMYVLTGSLVVPILFHVTIDLMALAIRPVIRGAWQPAAD